MIRTIIDQLKAIKRRITHAVLHSTRNNPGKSQTSGKPDKAHAHNLSAAIRKMILEEMKKATSGE